MAKHVDTTGTVRLNPHIQRFEHIADAPKEVTRLFGPIALRF
jgi:hypothetical protein